MKVAVIRLGIEGRKAVRSLKKRGFEIYATDLDKNIKSDDFEDLEIDLGFHDMGKISSADAVVLSPSIFNTPIAEDVEDKLFCDIIDDHRSLYTIGVTGTNGKTTTALMIADILERWGKKVLIGGNAGGGFEGYTELVLKASEDEYDFMVVEICDMTLEFADHCFNLDLIVLTNMGRDHLDHHGSLKNYERSLSKFLNGKTAILNREDPLSHKFQTLKTIFYDAYEGELQIFGKFNRLNAGAAAKVAELLDTPKDVIESALYDFRAPMGRLETYEIGGVRLFIGKTDNPSAMEAVLDEVEFDAIFIGTPRINENWRFEILDVILKKPPKVLVIFPGLEDTVDIAVKRAKKLRIPSKLQIAKDLDEVLHILKGFIDRYHRIFIGGNGQDKIIKVQKEIEKMLKGVYCD